MINPEILDKAAEGKQVHICLWRYPYDKYVILADISGTSYWGSCRESWELQIEDIFDLIISIVTVIGIRPVGINLDYAFFTKFSFIYSPKFEMKIKI